jgi:hypothetical protein
MANDVWARCEKANSRGRTVTVKIKWADFQLSTRKPTDGIGNPNKAWAACSRPRPDPFRVPAAEGRSTRWSDPLELFNRNPAVKRLNCLFVKCNRRYRPAPRPLAPTERRRSDSKLRPTPR